MSFNCLDLPTILKIAGGIIALVTLGKAVYEYVQERKDKRAKQFLLLSNILGKIPCFKVLLIICTMIIIFLA
jgi:hypothetical protein